MSKNLIITLFALSTFLFTYATFSHAQLPAALNFKEDYVQGKIIQLVKQNIISSGGMSTLNQIFKVRILQGKEKGKTVQIFFSSNPKISSQKLTSGELIILDSRSYANGTTQYSIYEPYRLNDLFYILLGFLLLIIFVGGKKGIGAVVGLSVSIAIIGLYIIPQIIHGADPLTTTIIGAFMILVFSTYIAHGISLKTTMAIIGTAISFLFAGWMATAIVSLMHTTGLGNEDIYNLQVGVPFPINPKGLLLGGILIGTLGALNDITTTQAITIFTLVKENPKQTLSELFGKGMVIGKEHIASLINTLVLAYAGTSLAVLIFFELNPAHLPWWVILNNEATIEEIIKSLVGSSAIILAVPITTFVAALVALEGTDVPKLMKSLFG